ncbi:MAG: PAS domain S-box protein [Elusimicrobia bacterium]|nr:PAS domain S-box protein [Elusimicrobiota bacterium]
MKEKPKTVKQLEGEISELRVKLEQANSENRKSEERHRESEERYKDFIESARYAIFTTDVNGVITSLNPHFEKLTGWNCAEWIGKDFSDIIHPEDRISSVESFIRLMKGYEDPFIELRVLTKSGKYIIGEFKSTLLKQNGEVIGAHGIAHDVTERKENAEKLKKYRDKLQELVNDQMKELIKTNEQLYREINERKDTEKKLQTSLSNFKKSLTGTVNALGAAVEKRDPYTSGHQLRVARLACEIAREMRLSEQEIDGIRIASLLHDIGKITVPAEILSKPGVLTELEYNLIKNHSRIGYEILSEIEFPWPIADIVFQHHERIDGSGYSQGLYRDQIMIEARILSVADVVEAMSSHRPYRPIRGLDKALKEISNNKGVLYDEKVVEACLRVFIEKGFQFE